MTLNNNRTAILCPFKLCASCHSRLAFELEISSGVKSGSNGDFYGPCELEIWQKNNRAPLLCLLQLWTSFRNHPGIQTRVTIRNWPHWGQICFDLCDLDLLHITLVNGNYSWKFHDDAMRGTLNVCTDRQTGEWAGTFIELLGRS